MELRDAVVTYRRRIGLTAGLIIVVLAVAEVWTFAQPVRYTSSLSLAVDRVHKQTTTDYQYDGYYALQAADLFAQTVVSWLQIPAILVEVYEQAGVSTDASAIRSIASRFRTKKYSAQNIVVTYTSVSQDEGQKLADALTKVIGTRTAEANRTSEGEALFEIRSTKPVIVQSQPQPILVGAIALVVGIILAVFLVPLVEYFAAPRPA